jgi:ergothioneine biosynthesis protein EgtB
MLAERYRTVRSFTTALTAPLSEEDCVVQSMPDASPTKWHLAHTTWFFETFVLARANHHHRPYHPQFGFLFNSYYEAVGERHPRPERGLLTRPRLSEVRRYRDHIDDAMSELLGRPESLTEEIASAVTLGLHHEQQHQELVLTDIQHAFSKNPLRHAYRDPNKAPRPADAMAPPLGWVTFPEGLRLIGHEKAASSGGSQGVPGSFAFDNEEPRHRVFVEAFSLGNRLVTNSDYLEFMLDRGYARPELWLSDGWAACQAHRWEAPLYWEDPIRTQGQRHVFTLHGVHPLDPAAPVCHVSYYEADAYARWAGARLATECEWEVAAGDVACAGNFLEDGRFEPAACGPLSPNDPPTQLFGDVWEWTQSPYAAYPGFVPYAGDFGEYNGKFMCNQMVLRGGSCATSKSHIRASYRNFFPPEARWQFTGIRLARGT